jgi:hypothetical protein
MSAFAKMEIKKFLSSSVSISTYVYYDKILWQKLGLIYIIYVYAVGSWESQWNFAW